MSTVHSAYNQQRKVQQKKTQEATLCMPRHAAHPQHTKKPLRVPAVPKSNPVGIPLMDSQIKLKACVQQHEEK
jgi:hypothetical protein